MNSNLAPDSRTTLSAIERLLADFTQLDVSIDLRLNLPIGAGFGTSAAGTLASLLAVAEAADLPVTFSHIGSIAHVAEVENLTGLGTASALLQGGFVLVREPGAPGIGLVDRLRFPANHSIVCACLSPILTRDVLTQRGLRHLRLARLGHGTFDAITKNPTISTFLNESREFGRRAGFETPRVSRLVSTMADAGALGAAQNMVGEAVHAVVDDSRSKRLVAAVTRAFPEARVFTSRIDFVGVRTTG